MKDQICRNTKRPEGLPGKLDLRLGVALAALACAPLIAQADQDDADRPTAGRL